jgi:hypothetical protein
MGKVFSFQEVLEMMAPAEKPEVAEARIGRFVSGEAHEDDDIQMGDTSTVALKCPLSNMRIRRAARSVVCPTPRAFDLDYFMELAKRSRKWQCPVTCASRPCLIPRGQNQRISALHITRFSAALAAHTIRLTCRLHATLHYCCSCTMVPPDVRP